MKVAVELLVACATGPRPSCETLFLASGDIPVPYPMSNVERLISGFEDHVLKHGSKLDEECKSSFSSRDYLKVGSGVASSTETLRNSRQVLEAVIIITELPEQPSPSCLITCGINRVLEGNYACSPGHFIKIMFPQARPKSYSERKLLKKAVKVALEFFLVQML